jgi:hypothetical protein
MVEGSGADSEIHIWQKMAEVYQQECFDRGFMSDYDKQYLYNVICSITVNQTLENFLSAFPHLKNYPELSRIFFRLKKALNGE